MLRHVLACALIAAGLLAPHAPAARVRAVPAAGAATAAAPRVPAPEDVLGFRPGEDRKLAAWSDLVGYFRRLDAASDRVRFEELGRTTLGAPFVLATISAPENLARLEELRAVQQSLADPRTLGPRPERRAEQLIARGKTVVLITCGVHSTEVGSTLSSALIAHRLASSDEPEVRRILRDTVVLLVPSLNPDGVDIVKRWYDRTLGTPFEGTTPPELYHKYVGHDNNRDWYAFTQVETQLTVDKIHNAWRPQIVHDIHQQGTHGSRLFLPPYMRPVEPNVPRQLVEGYTELGLAVARRMLAAGFKGITWDSTYDAWTPARAYSHYHGGVRILSETASARLATPISVKFEELRSREGYDPQKPSANFPEPWRGGEWRLRDITNYMTTAAFELMLHAADNRERWLRRSYEVGREAVRPRPAGELQGFRILPAPGGKEAELLRILQRGGVEIEPARDAPPRARGRRRRPARPEAGPFFVRLAQPYGAFAKALLEPQRYPNLREYPGGPPKRPYDVTAHTLPLLYGFDAAFVRDSVAVASAPLPPAPQTPWVARGLTNNRARRVAIFRNWSPSMDEGWTRWLFDQYQIPYAVVTARDVRAGGLASRFDAIVLPEQSARQIERGPQGAYPDSLKGGLGSEGAAALKAFVEGGGTLVAFNDASDYAIGALSLPVRNVLDGLPPTQFYAPGSIFRLELDASSPLAAGMTAPQPMAWFESGPAFEVTDPSRATVVARYPAQGDPLLSGWLLGAEKLAGKGAMVDVRLGRGHVVLFGFRPQYRAQSMATYPLLWNALRPIPGGRTAGR